MDKRLREEIGAWLEFYRELGIEDFYRRPPAPKVEIRNSKLESGTSTLETPPSSALQVPAPSLSLSPEFPILSPGIHHASSIVQHSGAPIQNPKSRIQSQTLSLFEATAPEPARRERETLEQIREDLGDCQRCRLAKGRKTIVFGQGNPRAELVFVGEAPGADEDEQGLPFVGRAGQLLNRMIQLIGLKREEVYICNVIKCRPPGNRMPERDEIETCSPFLFRQLEAIQPRLVCCLGAPAVRTVLGVKDPMTKIRGRFYDYGKTKAFVTFHPAYILRNAREEKLLREDFESVSEFLKAK